MRVALTGAEGMLGHAVRQVFSDVELREFTRNTLDITLLDSVMKEIRDIKPDFLIHAAAYTDVDGCESAPENAYRVNGIGTRNIAMACEEVKCPIIYISTDYVFDGSKSLPYDEWDNTGPINIYGLSKLMGERFVSSLTNRYYIVRTSWLYGEKGKNFVDTIVRLLAERESLDIVNDQEGSPTYTVDLAEKIREITGKGYGTYHVTNTGKCSWYDFAKAIASIKGLDKKIMPVTSEQFRRPARRPANSVLGNTMLRLEGISEARHWEQALREYLGA